MFEATYEAYNNLDRKQKLFIDIVYVQKRTYKNVVDEVGVDITVVRHWNTELDYIWRPITRAVNLWKVKRMTIDFFSFFKWIATAERKCHYCEITEEEIQTLKKLGLRNKREVTRGTTLELDRKDSVGKYDEANMVLCCYWCNNAKTDTFTETEFKTIGKAIGGVWKERLKRRHN